MFTMLDHPDEPLNLSVDLLQSCDNIIHKFSPEIFMQRSHKCTPTPYRYEYTKKLFFANTGNHVRVVTAQGKTE